MASATVYLVRHAKAGERHDWNGDDRDRPLSNAGREQSEAIGERLAERGATNVVSSPYVRCVQTLEPLGKRLDTEVAVDRRLLEGEPFEGVLEMIGEAEHGTVLCTHGDIIPAVIQALGRRGMDVQRPVDWRKATIWVLKRNSTSVVEGTVWPPPRPSDSVS